MNGRERVLTLLRGGRPDRLPAMPITMTFAARLHGVTYRDYSTHGRVLAEAQARVAEEFGFDHVSAISDPAREAADCGARIKEADDEPFGFDEAEALLADRGRLSRLRAPDAGAGGSRMADRLDAVARLKASVGSELVVEGWVEGPCAEAADLRGMNGLMLDFYDEPGFVRDLFAFVTEMEISFAKAQVAAGADIIGIGDAAASLVGPRFYDEFVWPFERRMVDAIHAAGAAVRLHICGNTRRIAARMGELACEIVDIDFLTPMVEARGAMGNDQVLLGNLDPVRGLRDGTPERVRAAVAECHRLAGDRFIVGAGCEVPRDTPHENLGALICYARESRTSERLPA